MKQQKRRRSFLTREERISYLFIAFPCILLLLFLVIPITIAMGMSFTAYDIKNPPTFIGIQNFVKMFQDEFFWIAFKNTVYYTVVYVPLGLLVALLAATFLNGNRKVAGLFRTFFYIPVLSSAVATATLWFWILNPQLGLLNQVLAIFNIQGPSWLYDSKTAMISVIMMSVWAGFGGNMMIFLAGLKGIPETVYESAKLDGANFFQTFFSITLPLLSKTTFLVSTMLIIGAFQVFDQAFVLTKGGPGNATITLVYYIYNNGFKNLKMGYASSISLVVFLLILSISIINFKLNKNDSGEVL